MLAIPTREPSSQGPYHTIPQKVNGLKDLPHGRKLSFTTRSNVQCKVAGSQRLLLAWVWGKLGASISGCVIAISTDGN